MVNLVKEREHELRAICEQRHVARLDLFGSAATGTFKPGASDLDFLVTFRDLQAGEHAKAYFGLLFDLEDLFGTKIDLVVESAIRNPYFREEIQASRRQLYAA